MTFYERIIRITGLDSLLITNSNGVDLGDAVEVVGIEEEILDPDTGKSLGKYSSVKARLEVTRVFDGFAVCKTPRKTKTVSLYQLATPMHTITSAPDYLNVDEQDVNPLPKTSDSKIKVGDRVRVRHL